MCFPVYSPIAHNPSDLHLRCYWYIDMQGRIIITVQQNGRQVRFEGGRKRTHP